MWGIMGNFRQLWLLSLLTQTDQFCTLSVAIKNEQLPSECSFLKCFFFFVHFCLSLFFFLICTDNADTCSVSLHIVSCIQGAVLGVSRDYNSDLSGEEFCLCNLLPPSCLQYSLSTGRWCALFRIPRFPHTEACLLTRDLWKCSGVGLPNLSSHPPLTQQPP